MLRGREGEPGARVEFAGETPLGRLAVKGRRRPVNAATPGERDAVKPRAAQAGGK